MSGHLAAAREHARCGRLADAERAYRAALADNPAQVEALRFLAHAALARSDAPEAVALLRRATAVEPGNGALLLELGVACRAAGDNPAARKALGGAMAAGGPSRFRARALLGSLLEAEGQPQQALLHYFRAILDAQSSGRWLNDATTDPSLRGLVRHAMAFAARERRNAYDRAFDAIRAGGSIARVDAALACYLREPGSAVGDRERHPQFVNLPALPALRYIDLPPAVLPAASVQRIAALQGEMQSCARANPGTAGSAFALASLLADSPAAANSAHPATRVPLYAHGTATGPALRFAPRLLAELDALPLVRAAGLGPDADAIELAGGQHAALRFGRSNALPVTVVTSSQSGLLQLTVGGEARTLGAGSAVTLDPTWGYALQNTGQDRVFALAFERWHPDLTATERQAFAAMAVVARDFDAQIQAMA